MSVDAYQATVVETAVFQKNLPHLTHADACILYAALGLVEEAGEIAGKVKKALRKGTSPEGLRRSQALREELGDVAWYLAQLAHQLSFPLSEVITSNLEKLEDRTLRGVVVGEGDNR